MAKKTPPKKTINVMLTDVSPYELEGTLQQLKDQVDRWIADHGAEARLCWDGDHWPQYSDSPSPQYEIKIDREETDAEQTKRLDDEAHQREAVEARERKELERLTAKFKDKK